jgi:LuxR family transcriptional regulator, maltose regulon positive regulatory protein
VAFSDPDALLPTPGRQNEVYVPHSDVEQPAGKRFTRAGAPFDVGARAERAPAPTVATKLLVPPAAPHLVERRRLLDALDGGIAEKLVLLSAPAGSGKTALLSSWVATRELPGAPCWLSLDADDNDASQLAADLLSALRSSGAVRRGSALERLTPPAEVRSDYFLPLLVNALSELRAPIVMVLDDIHELRSAQATAMVAFLVRHVPEQCRLVLSGRADPPLPIERLRMRGELTELRSRELAFDRGETAELCGRLELGLPAADVDSLWARTDGWAAALRLAAVSLRGHPHPGRFLADFLGSDRAVADYLVAEVLMRVSADQRGFMLRTSIVDSVDPELADALCGRPGQGAAALLELVRAGVPLEVLSDADGHRRDSYRYHPLLRELLRVHLRHAHPGEVQELHRRAARWYQAEGHTTAAIRHALSGADWEHAGALIAGNWLELFLSGRAASMRRPMAELPSEVLGRDQRLAAAFAGSRLQDGDMRGAERHLALARGARSELSAHEREQLEPMLAAVALHRARLRVHLADAERHARKLSRLARTAGVPRGGALQCFALASLAATRLWAGDPDGAEPALHETLALAAENGHELITLDCLGQLALVCLLRGELTRAEELSTAATVLAERHGWCDGPAVAGAYLAAGAGAYQRGEFERAEGLLSQAATAARTAEAPAPHAVGMLQALALAAAGSGSAARGALKLRAIRASLEAGGALPDYVPAALELAELRVLAAAGERDQLQAMLAAPEHDPDGAELLVRRASIELAANELTQAAASLARVFARAEEEPRGAHPATLVEAWLASALVEDARGEPTAARDALERALELAEAEPFLQAFLSGGSAVRELLERHASVGTAHPALLEVLLDYVGQRRPDVETLAEPLTEREMRILRYLPTMLSNAEIGAEIFVSLNTVKTHLRSIYRKLGAGGRADAVERARRVGLLPSGIKRPRVVHRR